MEGAFTLGTGALPTRQPLPSTLWEEAPLLGFTLHNVTTESYQGFQSREGVIKHGSWEQLLSNRRGISKLATSHAMKSRSIPPFIELSASIVRPTRMTFTDDTLQVSLIFLMQDLQRQLIIITMIPEARAL